MYVSRVAASMWRSRWACLLLLAGSIAGALALTYSLSLSHRSLHPRRLSFGVAQTSLLVDVGKSPLADSVVLTDDITSLAGTLAQMMGSATVLQPVARAVGTAPAQIDAQSQLVGEVSTFSAEAGGAQSGTELLGAEHHYSILARVDQSSFVVQLFTQAPTGAKAIRMANVAAQSLSRFVAQTASAERIPNARKIILRQLGPATGGTVDSSLPVEAAALLALTFFVLSTIALLVIKRWRRTWTEQRRAVPGRLSAQL